MPARCVWLWILCLSLGKSGTLNGCTVQMRDIKSLLLFSLFFLLGNESPPRLPSSCCFYLFPSLNLSHAAVRERGEKEREGEKHHRGAQ